MTKLYCDRLHLREEWEKVRENYNHLKYKIKGCHLFSNFFYWYCWIEPGISSIMCITN